MKSTVEDKGVGQKAISITLDREEVEGQIDRLVQQYRKKAALPGFRKGKVPADMVRSAYRDSIEQDLLRELLPDATEKAIEEHQLNVATTPRIEDLRFRPGEPLSFTAVVELWPAFEIQEVGGIELEEEVLEVDEQAIDEFLEAMQQQAATSSPVSRPSAAGDLVDVTILGVDQQGKRLPRAKKQDLRVEAGGKNLLKEFNEASIGIAPGETRLVRVQYPENFGDREIAGQQRFYSFRARQVLERSIPALDESFAQQVDGSDMEALRAKIRLRLEAEERVSSRQQTVEKLVEKLIEMHHFDVPHGIVERSVQNALARGRQDDPSLDEEQFRLALTPRILRIWKRRILLDAIARKESLTVSDEEMDERIRGSAGAGANLARIRSHLTQRGELGAMREELLEEKVLDSLLEKITVHRIQKPRQRTQRSNIIIP